MCWQLTLNVWIVAREVAVGLLPTASLKLDIVVIHRFQGDVQAPKRRSAETDGMLSRDPRLSLELLLFHAPVRRGEYLAYDFLFSIVRPEMGVEHT